MNISNLALLLAQTDAETAQGVGFLIGFFLMFVVMMVISLAILAGILWLIYDAVKVVPEPFHLLPPKQIFIALVPIVGIVWLFFIVMRVPKAFENYFNSIGRPQPGDYGQMVGLIWAIAACVAWIPYLNCLAGPAALICMILFIVKMRNLKSLVLQGGGVGGFPVMPTAGQPAFPQGQPLPGQVPQTPPTSAPMNPPPLPPQNPPQQ